MLTVLRVRANGAHGATGAVLRGAVLTVLRVRCAGRRTISTLSTLSTVSTAPLSTFSTLSTAPLSPLATFSTLSTGRSHLDIVERSGLLPVRNGLDLNFVAGLQFDAADDKA